MFARWTVRAFLVVILPLPLVGCVSNSPPQAIIGTWESGLRNKKRTMVFWDNGVWSFETPLVKETGTYKFVSEKQIEIKVDGPADEKPKIYKRTVAFAHHGLMHLTDVDTAMRTTWRRVRQP